MMMMFARILLRVVRVEPRTRCPLCLGVRVRASPGARATWTPPSRAVPTYRVASGYGVLTVIGYVEQLRHCRQQRSLLAGQGIDAAKRDSPHRRSDAAESRGSFVVHTITRGSTRPVGGWVGRSVGRVTNGRTQAPRRETVGRSCNGCTVRKSGGRRLGKTTGGGCLYVLYQVLVLEYESTRASCR